jgi:hypothetical protein
MLHAFKAFALALTAEIKDEFADSETAIRSDIRNDLLCSTREGPTFEPSLTLGAQRDIVEWGFIGDRKRLGAVFVQDAADSATPEIDKTPR